MKQIKICDLFNLYKCVQKIKITTVIYGITYLLCLMYYYNEKKIWNLLSEPKNTRPCVWNEFSLIFCYTLHFSRISQKIARFVYSGFFRQSTCSMFGHFVYRLNNWKTKMIKKGWSDLLLIVFENFGFSIIK